MRTNLVDVMDTKMEIKSKMTFGLLYFTDILLKLDFLENVDIDFFFTKDKKMYVRPVSGVVVSSYIFFHFV